MIRAFIINTDGTYFLADIHNDFETYGSIVDGDPDYVTLSAKLALICNDMGKAYNLPYNEKASVIMRKYLPTTKDWIAGNAIIFGLDDEECSSSLTDEQVVEINELLA